MTRTCERQPTHAREPPVLVVRFEERKAHRGRIGLVGEGEVQRLLVVVIE